MLTDLHVHLRQDEPGTDAASHFTPENAERYRAVAEERGVTELGVSEHIYRFRDALQVWDHELWRQSGVDDLEAYCRFVREETDLKLGIEADFVPGREDRTRALLEQHDLDYVIGSVHFVGGEAVDHPDYDIWGGVRRPEEIWTRYFEWLGEAASSGLFDVLAHPDLVKVWGSRRPLPDRDLRFFYEPAVEAMADSGIAVEVSTAGLRKPAAEIYPSRALLEMVADAGCPVTLSSDAHVPEHLGYGYDQALALLEEVGITQLAVFEGRERRLEPLG